ncbi:uncharacterized protein LOC128743050 [Sabethes cyaneus]|uniref:uncharacterized protein LOC128743050 n=1 Tax=Sabethes cyaneus TaxID=53552 RepID=UPI00237DF9BC|nr:uncharacterized protein LOC128743050 [Sabethes cyaneus]
MLRFGLLKYKRLNNAVLGPDELEEPNGNDNGRQQRSTATTMTATPVRQHPHLIHNELNGGAMKNTNSQIHLEASPPKSANDQKASHDTGKPAAIEKKKTFSSSPELDLQPPPPSSPVPGLRPSALSTSSPDNYRPLQPPQQQATPKKRTAAASCKVRIYKCIKRMLKRNNFSKEQRSSSQQQQQQVQTSDKSKVDYREIKSLLEKEKPSLDYDVNLAKCVDKPALIKKIALNLMKSAHDEGRSLVVAPEGCPESASIQSNLDQEAEYQRLCGESWYHENLPRDLSLELLNNKPAGSFVVRKSTTQQGCYALSLRVPPPGPKIAHYLIVRTASDGYQIKGFHKEFTSLRALIVHHSVMPESLPVPLDVPRPSNLAVKTKCDDDYDTVFDLPETVRA